MTEPKLKKRPIPEALVVELEGEERDRQERVRNLLSSILTLAGALEAAKKERAKIWTFLSQDPSLKDTLLDNLREAYPQELGNFFELPASDEKAPAGKPAAGTLALKGEEKRTALPEKEKRKRKEDRTLLRTVCDFVGIPDRKKSEAVQLLMTLQEEDRLKFLATGKNPDTGGAFVQDFKHAKDQRLFLREALRKRNVEEEDEPGAARGSDQSEAEQKDKEKDSEKSPRKKKRRKSSS